MNPIADALYLYHKHLERGGKKVHLDVTGPDRKKDCLHPSSMLLCERKAAYDVLHDLGKMKQDMPYLKAQELDFRVGYIFEWFVAEALHFQGSLLEYQPSVSMGLWCGSPDLLVDPQILAGLPGQPWLVDVKTVRSSDATFLAKRSYFPRENNAAQVEMYTRMWASMSGGVRPTPVLFYTLRGTMASELFTWDMLGDDASMQAWETGTFYDDGFEDISVKWESGFGKRLEDYQETMENWYKTRSLPERPYSTPDEHPFMCCDIDKRKKTATPSCPYFGACWGVDTYDPYKLGEWGRGWWE